MKKKIARSYAIDAWHVKPWGSFLNDWIHKPSDASLWHPAHICMFSVLCFCSPFFSTLQLLSSVLSYAHGTHPMLLSSLFFFVSSCLFLRASFFLCLSLLHDLCRSSMILLMSCLRCWSSQSPFYLRSKPCGILWTMSTNTSK